MTLLRSKGAHDRVDLARGQLLAERHVQVRLTEITVILRDLVLEDQMIAKGVPCQLGDQPVILVQIPPTVGMVGVGLLGVNWIIRRRMALASQRIEGSSEASEAIPRRRGE